MNIKTVAIVSTLLLPLSGAFAEGDTDQATKPKKDPAAAFQKLDTNGDGSVSLDEFKASKRAQKNPEKAEKGFNRKDTDKNGSLSQEEFTAKPMPKKKKAPAEDAAE